jgi:hypothetical protein
MADFQNAKGRNTEDRPNVAPVSDYTDKNGWVVPAGTVGTLTFSGGSRGWSFYARIDGKDWSWSIKAADLFRFVKASELAGVVVGNDLTTSESKRFLTADEVAKWSKTLGFDAAKGEVR